MYREVQLNGLLGIGMDVPYASRPETPMSAQAGVDRNKIRPSANAMRSGRTAGRDSGTASEECMNNAVARITIARRVATGSAGVA